MIGPGGLKRHNREMAPSPPVRQWEGLPGFEQFARQSEESDHSATEQQRSASIAHQLGTEIVTLLVGPDSHVFKIHKDLICKIKFYDSAFNGVFSESEGTMTLPEEEPPVIQLLVDYLYLTYIPLPPLPARDKVDDVITAKKEHLANLFSLYVFAEKILDSPLMNKTIDTAQRLCYKEKFTIRLESLLAAYENTKPSSKLRLFASELFIFVQKFSVKGDGEGYMVPDAVRSIIHFIKDDQDLLVDLFALNGDPYLDDPREKHLEKPCYFHTGCDGMCKRGRRESAPYEGLRGGTPIIEPYWR